MILKLRTILKLVYDGFRDTFEDSECRYPEASPSASPPLNFGGVQVDHKEKVQVYRSDCGILR